MPQRSGVYAYTHECEQVDAWVCSTGKLQLFWPHLSPVNRLLLVLQIYPIVSTVVLALDKRHRLPLLGHDLKGLQRRCSAWGRRPPCAEERDAGPRPPREARCRAVGVVDRRTCVCWFQAAGEVLNELLERKRHRVGIRVVDGRRLKLG
jgi:hypothetical protein